MPVVNKPHPTSTWVPQADRDTAWWIMKKLYACRVPYFQMLSPAYVKFFGMPESGDSDTNMQQRNELVTIQIPIGTMAEYYADDIQVSIPNPALTKEIYTRVMDHLTAWRHDIEGSLNNGNVPIDDLIKLDKFAAALFPHAKPYFDREFIESKFARKIGSILTINRDSFFQKPKPEPEDAPKHASFSSVFTQRKAGGHRWK